jgi:hypothetical protein
MSNDENRCVTVFVWKNIRFSVGIEYEGEASPRVSLAPVRFRKRKSILAPKGELDFSALDKLFSAKEFLATSYLS